MSALFDPSRHQPLQGGPWDPMVARSALDRIVQGTLGDFQPARGWSMHPGDGKDAQPDTSLYYGGCGILWALHALHDRGAAPAWPGPMQDYLASMQGLQDHRGSYMFGDLPILLLRHALQPEPALADEIAALVAQTMHAPERELMWGSPGTMLASLFMHRRTGEARFAELFRATAAVLHSQLLWSDQFQCDYWTQDMYGQTSSYLDAVHGFVATACVLTQGRALLDASDWSDWQLRIARTVRATAEREGGLANWRAWLTGRGDRKLVQFCHGAPGFVICLAGSPDRSLDDLLLAAGETTWSAGPLAKGSNLCHGTGGNGYAFLKLFRRTGDERWLDRARAFAMHGIQQTEADRQRFGQWRHSLWTGDLGFALYLLDCIEASDSFPTLDVFDVRLRPPPPGSS